MKIEVYMLSCILERGILNVVNSYSNASLKGHKMRKRGGTTSFSCCYTKGAFRIYD